MLASLLSHGAALAHDPAGTDVLMLDPLLGHLLHFVPVWVVLGAPPALLALLCGCYVWLRRHVDLIDEAE